MRVGARANASAQVDRDQSGQDASVVTKPLHSRYTAVTQPQLRSAVFYEVERGARSRLRDKDVYDGPRVRVPSASADTAVT